MTLADPTHLVRSATGHAVNAAAGVKQRDLRLDFFRGIAMFIILFAHTPGNFFTSWIPARWGFSDATEIFVFCSGMASAIAFGRAYDTAGWRLGTARVSFRVWQVYWAHLGLFFAVATLLAGIDMTGAYDKVYIGSLNLWKFFAEPGPQLVGLMTLTYVPNYFDILPMYMVVLAMMPLIMALSRVHLGLVALFVGGMWLFAQRRVLAEAGLEAYHFGLPAEPWSDRKWFFNPFGWQLIFFTGFAFMRGWLPKPPVTPLLIGLATVVVLLNIPLSNIGVREFGFDWARDWRIANRIWITKSDFGLLRYVHFLALAYLCWVAAGDKGARLLAQGEGMLAKLWQNILAIILKVGQQSLAVFIVSMFTARVSGFVMDNIGRDTLTVVAVNFAGMGVLVLTAYGAGWYKSQPWRKKADT
ncbi:OpgC domain-containing protein [Roseobacter sp. YSTF-M11]|uniref:OpgC domain-containing protein n=1 Tax=Roseobacter insulae TaxID=2859783 RepID=A0A9X1FXT6_9RHOB|nr:OpgC domain-containing protein [Roseobacter insulae]MBW4709623.1 OpgC domain-containing protein [Roseobacter insulae]